MISLKNILNKYRLYLIFITIIFGSTFILSLFNLLGISNIITNILNILIFITTYFIFGFIKGKNSNHKGYIKGLKIGIILCLILFVLGLFKFNFKTLLYYLILILSSIFGATIGINKKSNH